MKKILEVPFVSQYDLPRDSDGLGRACGLACVKMIIDYFGQEKVTLVELSDEVKMIKGGYIESVGWTNMGMTALMRNHGISCYSEEFRSIFNDVKNQKIFPGVHESKLIEKGIEKIASEIEKNNPVIISGIKNWEEKNKFHKMLVVGFEKDGEVIRGFYYHDPDDENRDGENNFVDINTFRKYWRKFAIFLDR